MKRFARLGSATLLAIAIGTAGASALAQGHDDHQPAAPAPTAPRLRGLGGAGQGGAQGGNPQGHDGTRQGHGRPASTDVHGSDKAPSDHGGGDHASGEHGGGHGEHGGHHELKSMNWTDFSNKETPPYVALLVNL